MNTKHLLDKILDKWPSKVVCLVIAIFLYFFHQASLIESKTFVVPLQLEENGIVMHVGSVPGSVAVVVRTSDEIIKSVLATDITASVSLDAITTKGSYTLPVKITLSENLMAYDPFEVRLKDDTITIDVDKKVSKYLPMAPSIVGEVAHGYEIDSVNISPSTIEISGPESIVNAIDKIYTTRINVSNAETNFSTETSYQKTNKLISIIDEENFRATISVKPVIMERDFTEIPVEILNLDKELEISGELPLVSIKLSGSMPVLEDYILSKHAVQVNLRDIDEPGTYELPLRYVLPSNLNLIEKSDDELTLTIVRKPLENTEPAEGGAE
ncbi:YbbR-like domain-containing protein [Treponema bryantii]|uniref:CdaR family protein n=1 Tax=Treponema bryantii TaxID=163 RepID=UPI0003B3E820|nr:CdaR family protein [Treponema bryantii]